MVETNVGPMDVTTPRGTNRSYQFLQLLTSYRIRTLQSTAVDVALISGFHRLPSPTVRKSRLSSSMAIMANLKSFHENSTARISLKRRILFLLLGIYVATAVMSKSPLLANKNTTGHLTLNRKQASPKKRCTYRLHGAKGCSAVLCSSCYSFLRPLHSKSVSMQAGSHPQPTIFEHGMSTQQRRLKQYKKMNLSPSAKSMIASLKF